jgi:hypothetical protein
MLIIEAFFVGIYVFLLFISIRSIIKFNLFIELFIIGFIKHFLSYYIGFQSIYCKIKLNSNYHVISSNIIIECLFEGLAFVYFGYLLRYLIKPNNLIYPFLLGFIIHIIAEYYGIHILFLISNCLKK